MPFLAAGDPDLEGTKALIGDLSLSGADLIEIGFPYSDPIADGPVIQSSYTRALGKHLTTAGIFQAVHDVSSQSSPLVAMVSYAIIFRLGPDQFLTKARDAGFFGLIVPDLPGDEAQEFGQRTRSAGLDLIPLVAPTTPAERMRKIVETASGFVYCIAVAGTTGARDQLAPELATMLKTLRELTPLPLCVGFGVSKPDQIAQLRGQCDGVIVGSALVRQLEELTTGKISFDTVRASIRSIAKSLADEAHRA